jgi:hypothetical protein
MRTFMREWKSILATSTANFRSDSRGAIALLAGLALLGVAVYYYVLTSGLGLAPNSRVVVDALVDPDKPLLEVSETEGWEKAQDEFSTKLIGLPPAKPYLLPVSGSAARSRSGACTL